MSTQWFTRLAVPASTAATSPAMISLAWGGRLRSLRAELGELVTAR